MPSSKKCPFSIKGENQTRVNMTMPSPVSSSTGNPYMAPLQDTLSRQSSTMSNCSYSSSSSMNKAMMDRLSSNDWMSDYQQSHVDVDLISVFGTTSSTCSNTTGASAGNAGCSSSRQPDNHPFIKQEEGTRSPLSPSATTARPVKPKTDWTGEYYSILVGQSPAAISQLPPSILKPPSQHAATRTSFRSRSLSWGSSVETKPSRPDGQEAMDVFKPSVDFSSLLTPSIDAALNSMHQIDSDKSVLQCSEDVVAAITPESPTTTDATATVPSEPICMDTEDEEPAEEEEEPASTLDTDVAMILALSRKEKEELLKKKQVPSQKKRTNVRRIREPQVKEFVEPKETDVLLAEAVDPTIILEMWPTEMKLES
ncbi:hypothetical protein MHU86_14156 [Fragilaria crotonensis]|nr:hypothetical protein MHU86_14156 [Fragilaria crotonensis]